MQAGLHGDSAWAFGMCLFAAMGEGETMAAESGSVLVLAFRQLD